MNELTTIFYSELHDKKNKELSFNFGTLFQRYKKHTYKESISAFYGFLREQKALGFIEEKEKGKYTILLDRVRAVDHEQNR